MSCLGDNMLTGLSVAKQCGIIVNKNQVIVVHVGPVMENSKPEIMWKYVDSDIDDNDNNNISSKKVGLSNCYI